MREQQYGYIVNVSSIAGLISVPFQGLYSASKFALEGFTEALRAETKTYGIRVVLVEPGDFHTGFTEHRQKAIQSDQESPYYEQFNKTIDVIECDEIRGSSPDRIAALVERIINKSTPQLRYMTGPESQKLAVSLKKMLPYRLFEWLIMKYYKLN